MKIGPYLVERYNKFDKKPKYGLEYWLRTIYNEYYVKYARIFKKPLTFSKWLQLPIEHEATTKY